MESDEDKRVQAMVAGPWCGNEGGAKHTKLYLDGRQTTLARHKSEIPEGTRKAILKALGLKST
ncbi:MAG TPA: hypothetical protein PLD19_10930 [Luteimonas sp.]|nr:hypothetical protein [Luteimonas sp.]